MNLPSIFYGDYFSVIFQRHPMEVLYISLLGMSRLLPIFCIVPFFGSKMLPPPIKIGMTIAVFSIILPRLLFIAPSFGPQGWLFYLLVIKEVFIGFMISFILTLPFYIAQSAGSFIANQQGIQGMEGAQSPLSIESTAPTGILYQQILTISFWLSGTHIFVIELITKSFASIPLNTILPEKFLHLDGEFLFSVLKVCHVCLSTTIQLSAPAALAMLMSDLFLGIINRMAPQVQVIYLLSALKAFMGLLFLWLAWKFIILRADLMLFAWMEKAKHMFS